VAHSPLPGTPPSVIDLFCGAGGSALGFKKAGFSISLGVDNDESSLRNFAGNLHTRTLKADLFETNGEEILNNAGMDKGDVFTLLGCSPCQGFTRLNRKPGPDERNKLVYRFVSLVEEISPRVFAFENVPELTERHRYFGKMLTGLGTRGYAMKSQIVDMRDHGVPQRRRRLVIVGSRDPNVMASFSFPSPSHTRTGDARLERWQTVRDAISDLPPLATGWKSKSIPNHEAGTHSDRIMRRIRAVPKNGGSRRQMPHRLWYKCHIGIQGFNDVMGRMAWDEPSPTMTSGCCNPTKGRFLHPTANRAITPREAARLQTFPDDFVFSGFKKHICSQIGNAFPPLYAEKLGRNILKAAGHPG